MPSIKRIHWLRRAAIGALLFAGCSGAGDNNSIHGEVKLDGAPLTQGSILFTPVKGVDGFTTGGEIKDGHYEISGAKAPGAGRRRVEIQAVRATGKMFHDPMLPPGQMAPEYVPAVATRFNTASTLEVDVHSGDTEANFEIESK